jgi:CRP-like cAMP-binding protein
LIQVKGKSLEVIDLISELPLATLAELEEHCRWVRLGANETVFDRDSQDRDIYFVVRGGVQIVNYSSAGREIAYARVLQGGYFGELAAIDGKPRSASVVTVEASHLAAVSPTVFLDLLSGHWDVTVKILHRFAAIVRYCDDRIMDLSTLRAEKRICAELLRLAKPDAKNPGGWLIYPMWTQKEIAGRVGSTRETVGRVLVQLADLEIVRRQSKALFVLDRARLAAMAEGGEAEEAGGTTRPSR